MKTQEHENTKTREHKNTRTQKHKNTKTQKYKNTKTQKHKNTKTQKHKNTKTQKHKNTKVIRVHQIASVFCQQAMMKRGKRGGPSPTLRVAKLECEHRHSKPIASDECTDTASPLENPDLLRLIFTIGALDFSTNFFARCACSLWRHTLNPFVPNPLTALLHLETSTQGMIAKALALPENVVRALPHTTQRRYGGGSYHVFDTRQTVNDLMTAHGGMHGIAERMAKREGKQHRRHDREDKLPTLQQETRDRLTRGLHALCLRLRSDSTVANEHIRSGGKRHALDHVLRNAARMHWLYEHTNGEYEREVEECVRDYGEHKGYFPGIYAYATSGVQLSSQFKLPVNGLPWLPQFANTADALQAALYAADDTLAAKTHKQQDLAARRQHALAQRVQAFMAACETRDISMTVVQLKDVACLYDRNPFGTFFDRVLRPDIALQDVVEAAADLHALDRCAHHLAAEAGEPVHLVRSTLMHTMRNCVNAQIETIAKETLLRLRDAQEHAAECIEKARIAKQERAAECIEKARIRKQKRLAVAARQCANVRDGRRCENMHRMQTPTLLDGCPDSMCAACVQHVSSM